MKSFSADFELDHQTSGSYLVQMFLDTIIAAVSRAAAHADIIVCDIYKILLKHEKKKTKKKLRT